MTNIFKTYLTRRKESSLPQRSRKSCGGASPMATWQSRIRASRARWWTVPLTNSAGRRVCLRVYTEHMAHPIRVDNSRPATVEETAKALGVSKRRRDEIVREVRRIVFRDAKTGNFVIRARRTGTSTGNNSSVNASTKAHKTTSRRAKASR